MVDKRLLTAQMVLRGYNQKDLAEAIGMSKNTFNLKINGKKAFNTEEVQRICSVLNINSGAEKSEIFLRNASQKRDEESEEME